MNRTPTATSAQAPFVPFARKLAFAVSWFGSSACIAASSYYVMFFYTDVALLGAGLAGLASGISRVFDAINDPIMGYIGDKTQTQWGRRRPWIIGVAIPFGLVFVLLFSPPDISGQLGLFCYFLVCSMAFSLCQTMLDIPGAALTMELSSDYQERTQLFAWKMAFHNLGMICGGFMILIVAGFAEARTGYSQVAAMFATLSVVLTCLIVFAPERREVSRGATASFSDFWHGYKQCVRNRPFMLLLATFFMMSIGGGLALAVGVYACVYWLGFTQAEMGLVFPVVFLSSICGLPFWTWWSGRIGKDVALKRLMLYEIILLSPAYFLVPYKPLVYTFLILYGFGLGGFVLTNSILADVLDVDELETGQQRAGAFFAFWTLSLKIAIAAGPIIAGTALEYTGYVPNAQQTPLVIETLRWLYGPIPTFFVIVGYLLFRKFSLSREKVAEIQAELVQRREVAELAS